MINDYVMPKEGQTRFIFFSGKGGVGKSTMSSATAVWLARQGYRTLLVTTDPAPNLSDIFGQEIGHNITQITGIDNLSAIEINPDTASEEYRENIISPMKVLLDEKSQEVVREQLKSPCVEEVAAFDKFIDFIDDPQYDVVVFDTAPTGHTIRLLELPSGWAETLQNSASTCIGPGASLKSAKAKYEKAISYLQDSDRTSFVFVLRPENMSLLETKRSTAALEDLGIHTSFLIINGVIPHEVCTDDFFVKKSEDETSVIERVGREFSIEKALFPLMDSEVAGRELLVSVGDLLFEGRELSQEAIAGNVDIEEQKYVSLAKDVIEQFLVPVNSTRFVFFTGKGGVGKSTMACTTGVHLAEKGFKTLVVTTDPASHLHEIFGQRIDHRPIGIDGNGNLFAARIDQREALQEYRARILDAIKDMDESTKRSVEEDLNSPCAEEMAAFEKFMSYFETCDYEVVIFDTAPTGHTLRLLELPSDWKGFIDMGTLAKKTSDETKNKYMSVIETMRNKEKSTFIFVMYPEYTPIIEAWRASEDLKEQVGIETSLVAVNYLLPQDYGKNEFFNSRRRQQKKYLSVIKEKFKKPLFCAPLFHREPKGIEDLKEFGSKIFGDENGR